MDKKVLSILTLARLYHQDGITTFEGICEKIKGEFSECVKDLPLAELLKEWFAELIVSDANNLAAAYRIRSIAEHHFEALLTLVDEHSIDNAIDDLRFNNESGEIPSNVWWWLELQKLVNV